MTVKMIHPDTGVVREVPKDYALKIRLLTRAGFVPFDSYRPPKVKTEIPELTVAEVVEKEGENIVVGGKEVAAEKAVHAPVAPPAGDDKGPSLSGAARKMVEKFDLDASLITPTGRGEKITKTDVKNYMEQHEAAEAEAAEAGDPPPEVPEDAPDMTLVGEEKVQPDMATLEAEAADSGEVPVFVNHHLGMSPEDILEESDAPAEDSEEPVEGGPEAPAEELAPEAPGEDEDAEAPAAEEGAPAEEE